LEVDGRKIVRAAEIKVFNNFIKDAGKNSKNKQLMR
jgi:hypothetical protein